MSACLFGSMVFNKVDLGALPVNAMKRDLTVKVWDHANETTTYVKAYKEYDTHIHVPRQYGLIYARKHNIQVFNSTSTGQLLKGMAPVTLREYQHPFVDSLYSFFADSKDNYDCMAEAATGKGKTVMSLEVARRLGRTIMVLVDQESLRDQWKEEAMDKFGMREEDIGFVQGKVCDFEDKMLVIGMVQSLYNRTYDDWLYEYFGTVIFDECHTVGAEQFSNVLGQFAAEHRWGVSATVDRGDELQKLLHLHLGEVQVRLAHKHKKSIVRYVEYDGVVSWYANISPKNGRYLSELSEDDRRNSLLATLIKGLYDTGRVTLAVSDRIEHLYAVRALCYYAGIPMEEMGIVAGTTFAWKYAKDATPPRKPVGLVKGAEYTPVSMQYVRKKVTKSDEHKRIKGESRVIFATYGMFNKGVDVPRVSAGIDLTPRSKAKQVHGRILRIFRNKLIPIWVTIRDVMSYKAEHQFLKRISDYLEDSAEIYQWHSSKGKRKVDPVRLKREVSNNWQRLKGSKIVINHEGENTVIAQSSGTQY